MVYTHLQVVASVVYSTSTRPIHAHVYRNASLSSVTRDSIYIHVDVCMRVYGNARGIHQALGFTYITMGVFHIHIQSVTIL